MEFNRVANLDDICKTQHLFSLICIFNTESDLAEFIADASLVKSSTHIAGEYYILDDGLTVYIKLYCCDDKNIDHLYLKFTQFLISAKLINILFYPEVTNTELGIYLSKEYYEGTSSAQWKRSKELNTIRSEDTMKPDVYVPTTSTVERGPNKCKLDEVLL
jgi:hypothetical protein